MGYVNVLLSGRTFVEAQMANAYRVVLVAISMAAIAPIELAGAQTFPNKPVRLVVGFQPGGGADITARMIAPKLSEIWGQPVVVDNRAGGGRTLAAAVVARAIPDGHTLLVASTAFAATPALHPNLPYSAFKDFAGVAQIGYPTSVLTVPHGLGVKSVADLAALSEQRQGKLMFGSSGAGSGNHLSAEIFKLTSGIKAVHVGFKGQPEMMVELLAGRIHFGFLNQGAVLPLIRDGRLVA